MAVQVFGVTQDPFIVYSSNIFAILSLRALYGFVNTVLGELRYLGPAVALVRSSAGSEYALPAVLWIIWWDVTLGGLQASRWMPLIALIMPSIACN